MRRVGCIGHRYSEPSLNPKQFPAVRRHVPEKEPSMKKTLLLGVAALAFSAASAHAADNYVVKDATGATITFRAIDNSGIYLPKSNPSHSDGTTITALEDAPLSNAAGGVVIFCKRTDAPAASAGTDGDAQFFNCDDFGNARVSIHNADGSEATVATDKTEDVAHANGDTGPAPLVIQDATPQDNASDGEYANPQMDDGALWVRPLQTMATVDATITRIADHLAYGAGDVISDSTTVPTVGGFTFTGACRVSGGSGIITDIIVTDTDDAVTALQGKLFIFDQAVTAVNDNAAFAVTDAEAQTLVTAQTFTITDIGNQGQASIEDLAIGYTCSGSANLRFLLQASNAYDPAANSGTIKIRLKVLHTS
jgi:hypothetical protein